MVTLAHTIQPFYLRFARQKAATDGAARPKVIRLAHISKPAIAAAPSAFVAGPPHTADFGRSCDAVGPAAAHRCSDGAGVDTRSTTPDVDEFWSHGHNTGATHGLGADSPGGRAENFIPLPQESQPSPPPSPPPAALAMVPLFGSAGSIFVNLDLVLSSRDAGTRATGGGPKLQATDSPHAAPDGLPDAGRQSMLRESMHSVVAELQARIPLIKIQIQSLIHSY